MKKALVLILGVCFVSLIVGSVAAREGQNRMLHPVSALDAAIQHPELSDAEINADIGLRNLYESAVTDTYCLVWYNFETCTNPPGYTCVPGLTGWGKKDGTAQPDTFFHVDDFVGVGPGAFGLLVPLEGTKSMWCGCRASATDEYVCGWINAPGYGNLWSQYLGTGAFEISGALTVSFTVERDLEVNYDFVRLQYDAGFGAWTYVPGAAYTAQGVDTDTFVISLTRRNTKLRFEFLSDQLVSDQDGDMQTDGGCILDAIRVKDEGLTFNNYEDFESAAVGAHNAGIWQASYLAAFGKFSGLYTGLQDKDVCGENLTRQVVFFIGSPYPSSSYADLYDTPFCIGGGGILPPCQSETVISPKIDITKYSISRNTVQNGTIPVGDLPSMQGADLRFGVYGDLPRVNLVYYQWEVRRWIGTCPTLWQDREYVYYVPDPIFVQANFPIGDLCIDEANSNIQVAVGITDMCDVWYTGGAECAQHTPTPWIDNVRVYRYRNTGPVFSWRSFESFQDNFPPASDVEGFIRMDEGQDVNQDQYVAIMPGDTLVLEITALAAGGIKDVGGSPAVYMHCRPTYIGAAPAKPVLSGADLAGSTVVTAPVGTVNFKYIGMSNGWTIIQFEPAYSAGGNTPSPNKFMVDLNDELFTRGYQIDYYFTAIDLDDIEVAWPRYARSGPPYYEVTTLPSLNSDVLYVDDAADGSETYWMDVFDAVLTHPNHHVDKYDVLGPGSGVDDGPGSRVTATQLNTWYKKIVWDCGQQSSYTISDGDYSQSDKSGDCDLLIEWMASSDQHSCGLWILGDDVADDLNSLGSTPALTLMNTWCGVDYVANSYYETSGGAGGGGVVKPLVTADTDHPLFIHLGVPDKFYVDGSCPFINNFDVLEKTADGKYVLDYPIYNSLNWRAGISSELTNDYSQTIRTLWFGFAWALVRDDALVAPQDRNHIASDVFAWFNNEINEDVTGNTTPKSYNLAQNFPNPFNPSTSIKFDMKEKGFVALKVYNVAGQLVRTLVNGTKDAGSYTITWDGKNNRGGAVASGIYFYKMETKDFSQTKKMVMLR